MKQKAAPVNKKLMADKKVGLIDPKKPFEKQKTCLDTAHTLINDSKKTTSNVKSVPNDITQRIMSKEAKSEPDQRTQRRMSREPKSDMEIEESIELQAKKQIKKPTTEKESSTGIKKKKLVKISEKAIKSKAVSNKRRGRVPVQQESSSEQSEDNEEDSVQGKVEFVDDEVDHLNKSQKIDHMFQKTLEMSKLTKDIKKDNNSLPQTKEKQQMNLQSFLHIKLDQGIPLNQEQTKDTIQSSKHPIYDLCPIQQQTNLSKEQEIINEAEDSDCENSIDIVLKEIDKLQAERILKKQQLVEENNQTIIVKEQTSSQEKYEAIDIIDDYCSPIEKEEQNKTKKNVALTSAAPRGEQVEDKQEFEQEQSNSFHIKDRTFNINGKFKLISLSQIENVIRRNKGFIKTVISNAISYYLVGSENVNKSKLTSAQEKNIAILHEPQFISQLEKLLGKNISQIIEELTTSTPSSNQSSAQPEPLKLPKEQVHIKDVVVEHATIPKTVVPMKSGGSGLSSWLPATAAATIINPSEEHFTVAKNVVPIKSGGEGFSQQLPTTPAITNKFEEHVMVAETEVPIKSGGQGLSSWLPVAIKSNQIDAPAELITQPKKEYLNKKIERKDVAIPMEIEKPIKIKPINENSSLWTHKYAPQSLADCVGNSKSIAKLEEWLLDWEKVVIHNQKSEKNWKENPNARACLISGPPGIGKTSTVRLLAQKYDIPIVEWNASDVRNKIAIEQIVNPLKDNQTLNFDNQIVKKRTIILMDEVDGMSSGDIGGNQSLIKIIKETKNPIFCICNDRFSQKLRSLSNSCFDVRFQKPSKSEVANRLLEICKNEGLKSDRQTLELLAESVNTDIRQSLNLLQMQSKKSKSIESKSLIKDLDSFKKDDQVAMSVFEATRALTTRMDFSKMTFTQKMDLYFLDYQLIPLLMQENYLDSMHLSNKTKPKLNELESMVMAANLLAESDVIGDCIRSGSNWSLLPDQGFLTSIYMPEIVCQKISNYPQMSSLLGNMSSQRKTGRLLRELRFKVGEHISGNRNALQMDYLDSLAILILQALEIKGKDGIESALNIMVEYNISPEMFREHLIVLSFNRPYEQQLSAIPSEQKSGLTRAFNKRFKDDVKPDKKTKKNNDISPAEPTMDDEEGGTVIQIDMGDDESEGVADNVEQIESQQDINIKKQSKISKKSQNNSQTSQTSIKSKNISPLESFFLKNKKD